jgi:LysM repeat protein
LILWAELIHDAVGERRDQDRRRLKALRLSQKACSKQAENPCIGRFQPFSKGLSSPSQMLRASGDGFANSIIHARKPTITLPFSSAYPTQAIYRTLMRYPPENKISAGRDMILKSGVLIALLLIVSSSVLAQDYPSYLAYYEDENPGQLDTTLTYTHNICLEAVLRLNPDLDINNITYGDELRLPVGQACYQYDQSAYGRSFGDGYPPRLKYYEHGKWLEQPYYSDDVVYVRPTTLDDIALKYNLCMDDLLAENILLHDFERYKTYALESLDVFIPDDAPPCDPNWTAPTAPVTTITIEMPENDITPLFFVNHYNLCPEEIPALRWRNYTFWSQSDNEAVSIEIPKKSWSCYSEAGQRLRYYDNQGRRLEAPVYSDLAVYIAAPGETLPAIADKMGVCLLDLVRVNHFVNLPLGVEVELFIPPAWSCLQDVEARLINATLTDITSIAHSTNICPEILLPLNAHFSQLRDSWYLDEGIYDSSGFYNWLVTPINAHPCYFQIQPHAGDSIFDVERAFNICYEEFQRQLHGRIIPNEDLTFYIRHDTLPCYNEAGQRLHYPNDFSSSRKTPIQRPEVYYADRSIHIFQREDTVYSISQAYNVCVSDLLKANPMLVSAMPTGYPTFIPSVRPCYDEASGRPLIYETVNGQSLSEPHVDHRLMYYGSQPIGYISHYYNVCANRIEDANWAKKNRITTYLGWIIPTDRPPCYDADGSAINYVCYRHPIDFHVDYSRFREPINFDNDGTHCYDLALPETLVWHQNKPYKVLNYEDDMLTSRVFMAWCFGVSLTEINAINEDSKILSLLPFHWRAIPVPTRDCYIQNPGVLDGHTLHTVEIGEALSSIARRYEIPYQWIAVVNDLDSQNTIYPGQTLIIPDAPTFRHFYFLIGAVSVLLASWAYWRRQHNQLSQKSKND